MEGINRLHVFDGRQQAGTPDVTASDSDCDSSVFFRPGPIFMPEEAATCTVHTLTHAGTPGWMERARSAVIFLAGREGARPD